MLVSWIKGGMHLVAVACFPHVRTEFQILSILPTSSNFQTFTMQSQAMQHPWWKASWATHRHIESHHDAEMLRSPKLQVEDDAHGAHPPMGPAGLGGPGSPWPEITECHFAVRCFVMFCGSPGHGPLDFHWCQAHVPVAIYFGFKKQFYVNCQMWKPGQAETILYCIMSDTLWRSSDKSRRNRISFFWCGRGLTSFISKNLLKIGLERSEMSPQSNPWYVLEWVETCFTDGRLVPSCYVLPSKQILAFPSSRWVNGS